MRANPKFSGMGTLARPPLSIRCDRGNGALSPALVMMRRRRGARRTEKTRRQAWAPVLLGVLLTVWSAPAWAHGGAASNTIPPASELPPGPIKKDILALERTAHEEKHADELLQRPISEALRSMERMRGAKAAGDERHGSQLEQLAKRWVRTAKAVLRAVQLERAATEEAERLTELEEKVERAASLLSEQQARLGRLQAQVEQAEKEAAKRRSGDLADLSRRTKHRLPTPAKGGRAPSKVKKEKAP